MQLGKHTLQHEILLTGLHVLGLFSVMIYLLVVGSALGKVGGCSQRVGLLHHIGGGVDSKADKASHVEGLHNAIPALPPEPLIVPRHILAG